MRLVTGCSWEDAERLCGHKVSDTTARARRDEWIEAGVFDAIADEAIRAYDKIIGLDLSEVAVDGSLHKSPAGGEGTGKNPTDRAKLGWKWSVLTDANGIPIGWTIDGANRHDSVLLEPTLDDADRRGLLGDIETIWLDRGYDSDATRPRLCRLGIDDAVIAKKRKRGAGARRRSPNPWACAGRSNAPTRGSRTSAQLRRNTDRKIIHRLAQFALAVAFLLTAKLIDWRNRWCTRSGAYPLSLFGAARIGDHPPVVVMAQI